MAQGKLCVIEMGRCSEKKLESARLSGGRCCVLGTLGSAGPATGGVFDFRFLPGWAVDDVASVVEPAAAGTWLPLSLEPLAGLEGLDDEQRRWCRVTGRLYVAPKASPDSSGEDDCGAIAEATRLTDEGSIVVACWGLTAGTQKRSSSGEEAATGVEKGRKQSL